MKNKIFILIGAIIILILGICFYFYQRQKTEVFKEPDLPSLPPLPERPPEVSPLAPITSLSEATNSQISETTKKYTLAEVQKHNSRNGCWSVINGKVYDLTSWIDQHPGVVIRF